MTMKLPFSKRDLRKLSLRQLAELDGYIRGLIREAQAKAKRPSNSKEVLAEKVKNHKTYRQVSIRCGKDNCKCSDGSGHGPYWYAYWSEGGRTKSQYVGKKLPHQRKK